MKKMNMRFLSLLTALVLVLSNISGLTVHVKASDVDPTDEEIVLRVCNWEEYIDEGGWEEDEVIDLESGDIFGENSMIEDFEEWYMETYGVKVRVEYSTFGTNEDLYNMLTLGDVFDLVCPSEYMIMKLMAEDKLVPLSDSFFDTDDEYNYYTNGVSPYIRNIFETHEINGETWDKYAAGYMWGVTGFVYNPEIVSEEEASTWHLFENEKYKRQITVKDNVRDTYFSTVGALKSDLLTSEEFLNDPNYVERLQEEMNDTSPEMIAKAQDYIQDIRENLYSFETDSGKADMLTGKVVANYQWSGDAVYIMDLAEEDDCYLNFAVPVESTNVYFDGWAMLKVGIGNDTAKQQAAEAFINFLSRPDNVVRNMYYIGYTSVIAAAEDGRVLEYADWCYGAEVDEEEDEESDDEEDEESEDDAEEDEESEDDAEEDEESEDDAEAEDEESEDDADEEDEESEDDAEAEDEESEDEEDADDEDEEEEVLVEYSVAKFFIEGDDEDGDFTLLVSEDSLNRQLLAQYPSEDILNRASIMVYFDAETQAAVNQMWVNIRCMNINDVPVWVWPIVIVVAAAIVVLVIRKKTKKY